MDANSAVAGIFDFSILFEFLRYYFSMIFRYVPMSFKYGIYSRFRKMSFGVFAVSLFKCLSAAS